MALWLINHRGLGVVQEVWADGKVERGVRRTRCGRVAGRVTGIKIGTV